jgi:hypothetical protein
MARARSGGTGRALVVALGLIGVLALQSCAGDGGSSTSVSADVSPTTAADGSGATAGATAPTSTPPQGSISEVTGAAAGDVPATIDWSAPLIGGGEIDMRGFRDRAVMLWFWAPY